MAQYILKGPVQDGIFLELGACDGVLYSNTKMLEDHYGFSGILIEPVEKFYQDLVRNRSKSKCFNCAVSDSNSATVEYVGTNACSGISSTINKGAMQYVDSQVLRQVPNRKLSEIIADTPFAYIDIMIVDVEGGEMRVLKSMDWDFPVFIVIVEAHSGEVEENQRIADFMYSKGFVFKERQRGNHVFYNPNYARKNLFKEIN